MTEHSREEGEPGPRQVRVSRATARVPEEVGAGVFATGAVVLAGGHEFLIDFVQRIAPPPRIVARVILPLPVVPALIQALRTNIGQYERRFGPIVVPRRGESPSSPAQETPQSADEAGHEAGASPAEGSPVAARPQAGRTRGTLQAGDVSSGGGESREDVEEETRAAEDVPIEPGTPPGTPTIEEVYAELKFPEDVQAGRYANGAVVRHELGAFGLDFVATVFPRPLVTARVLLPAVAGPDLLGSLVRSWEPLRRRPG
jgi:hypothetical protein